jgi:probable HAF family extracellular repeat protein
MKGLGTLGGQFSVAYGINNSGQVSGYAALKGDGVTHAFLFSSGKMTDIDTLNDNLSRGMAINGRRDVGSSSSTFLFSGGVMVDLNTLVPQNSGWVLQEARSINDAAQISGIGALNGNKRGFLLSSQ